MEMVQVTLLRRTLASST